MRIAIVSDIHGNLTAFEAVLADLRLTSPDLILHGGDLPHGGARPAEIVDRIRDLGWQGVLGNTDEMLFAPESLAAYAERTPQMRPLLGAIQEMAAWTRQALGEERMEWLRGLPMIQKEGTIALVHASPGDTWRSPVPEASDSELLAVYGSLGQPVAVYGHIHRSFVRDVVRQAEGAGPPLSGGSTLTVANSGSVSLPYDGDPRAAYLLLDFEQAGNQPVIRRVEYEVGREVEALSASGLPHADWVGRMLRRGGYENP